MMDWKAKAKAATDGSRFGAMIDVMLDVGRDAIPRFVGKANVTSDGFVMCDFVDRDGNGHMGAFAGDASDLVRNISGLAAHLELNDTERAEFADVALSWIGKDWSSTVASNIRNALGVSLH